MKTLQKILILFFCAGIVGALYYIKPEKQLRDASVLVVGTSLDYPPYAFIETDTSDPAGLDVDVISEIAERMHKELLLKDMPFSSLIFSLLTGDIDMIAAGMSPTERRARMVTFTKPYLVGQSLVVFTKKSRFVPQGLQDLQGKTVAVNTGYVADIFMSKQEGVNLVKLDNPSDSFMAVQVGSVDAFVASQANVQTFLEKHSHPEQFATIEISDTQEICAFAVGKNNKELAQELDQIIELMAIDGTMQKIKQKWGFHD